MVVSPKSTKDDKDSVQSRTPTVLSVVLHVVVLMFVIFGLPHWKKEIEIVDSVPVELIANVGEITAGDKPPVEAPKPDKVEPPTKIEKPKPEVKKTESTPPAPQEDVLKEPPKPDEKVEKIPDKVFPKKEDKKDEKKPDPKKPDVKKPDPKKDKNDEKSFESLLSDLAPAEKKQQEDAEIAKKVTNAEPSPNVSRFSTVLSISELDALRQQLGQCWSIMAGAESADDLRVEVQVSVNADRTVNSAKVVDLSRYGSDTFFRAAADSALRALRNPLCTPLNLPSDKYDQWHDMTIVFDPKEMF